MKVKPWIVKFLLNIFPALFFQGIRVKKISPDFQYMKVKIRKSLLNKNLARTIFGGTIFSAADPCIAVMYWQIFNHRDIEAEAWLKRATIDYIRQGKTSLTYEFRITEADIEEALRVYHEIGKYECWHQTEAIDKRGKVCAIVKTQVHVRPRKAKGIGFGV